jgi:hypothetical protein
MKKVAIVMAMLFVGMTTLVQARTHNLDSVKMKVELPNDWKTETEGDLLTSLTPDEKLAVVFFEATGVKAVLVDGTGKVEGKPVEWSMGIYNNGGKILIMLGFADPAAVKKYEPQLMNILKSLKKA